MNTTSSVRITYWAVPDTTDSILDLEGIEEFRNDLEESYVAAVRGRRGECGGGLYELAIEIISNLSFADDAGWLVSGMAFDMLKSGTKSLLLRPLIAAYRKLKERNSTRLSIGELRVTFRDSTLIIYNIFRDDIFQNLESILIAVAKHYYETALASGERPYEIHVPVFEDLAPDRLARFRVLLDVDETILPASDAYLVYWGLWYDHSNQSRVLDVKRKLLVDAEFFTQERYWAEWKSRWAKERANRSGPNPGLQADAPQAPRR